MSRESWDRWVGSEAASVRDQGRWRWLRPLDGTGPRFHLARGEEIVSFASNDYLGLASHPAVRAAAHEALDRWGAGAGSSRLIVGDRPVHSALEEDLAAWRGAEAALVFPTGYQTNLGVLTTFGARARIVSDELNHASIIDGARLAKADVAVHRHLDLEHAARLVADSPGRCLLVADTVFSMDGDVSDVEGLADICRRYGSLLVLDDAHAVFAEGRLEDPDVAHLRVGTLSKALGSQGGYVTGPRGWIDLMVNRARSFIFTTGLAPAAAGAAQAAVAICRSPEGDALRCTLRGHVEAVRPGHPTPIIPVVIGDESAALGAAETLLEQGLLVPAIRPPTVPAGTSRLRVSLSAAHRADEVQRLIAALARLSVGGRPGRGQRTSGGGDLEPDRLDG